MKILSAEFRATAVDAPGWPPPDVPELAFAGRSNVGKSSMINALVGRRNLVRVSNTPGRTRTLNFFDVAIEDDDGARRSLRLCDLPGYGFAKVSRREREQWREMIEAYLTTRATLCAVVCIVDGEVGLTEDDIALFRWLAAVGREAVVAATKIDRLRKARRHPALGQAARVLGLPPGRVMAFSATERIGVEALWARLLEAARPPGTEPRA